MKHLFLLSLLCVPFFSQAQIYGNTLAPDYGAYGQSTVLWLKIITGPSDSGNFTHYGLYNHPTLGGDCDIKFALYTDHATSDRPDILLGSEYEPNPTNGAFNEIAVDPPIPLSPSTTYWMGLRTNCTYGGGRVAGEQWANPPLKYYESYSFFSGWPDPVNPGSLSNFNTVNNVTWWIVANDQVLPVEMLSFTVTDKENKAMLTWEVASEINNSGWNIQRSTNGFTWNTIGFVEGQGDSYEQNSYSYMDEYTQGGRIFYRLEQEDYDGQRAYSEIKAVKLSSQGIYIYPTLTNERLDIGGLEQSTEYQIYNYMGELLFENSLKVGESINVSQLNSGVHFIYLNNEFFKFNKI